MSPAFNLLSYPFGFQMILKCSFFILDFIEKFEFSKELMEFNFNDNYSTLNCSKILHILIFIQIFLGLKVERKV